MKTQLSLAAPLLLLVASANADEVAPAPREATIRLGNPRLATGSRIRGIADFKDGTIVVGGPGGLHGWSESASTPDFHEQYRVAKSGGSMQASRGDLVGGAKEFAVLSATGADRIDFPLHASVRTHLGIKPASAFQFLFSVDDELYAVTKGQLLKWVESWKPLGFTVHPKGELNVCGDCGSGRLAFGFEDGSIRLWDCKAGRECDSIRAGGAVLDLSLSEAGSAFAAVFLKSEKRFLIKRFDLDSGRETATWTTTSSAITSSRDGRVVALRTPSGRDDGTHHLELREADSGRLRATLKPWCDRIRCFAFSHDDRRLLAAGDNGTVHIWEVATGKSVGPDRAHQSAIHAIRFRPDGGYETASGDAIQTWNRNGERVGPARSLRESRTIDLQPRPGSNEWISSGSHLEVAISIIRASDGTTVRAWKLDRGEYATAISYTEDEASIFASIAGKGLVRLDLNDLTIRKTLSMQVDAPSEIVCAGNTLIVRDGATLLFFDVKSGERLGEFPRIAAMDHSDTRRRALAVSPDRKWLALIQQPQPGVHARISIWNVETMRSVEHIDVPVEELGMATAVVFTTDRTLAVGDTRGRIWVADLRTKSARVFVQAHIGAVTCLTVSPGGKQLGSGSSDATANIWRRP